MPQSAGLGGVKTVENGRRGSPYQKDGMAKCRQMAARLEQEYPEVAAALLEGLEECFTM